MSGVEPGVIAITQRELLLEMREDNRGLKATVEAIARDQALGVERRANMQRSADGIVSRLDQPRIGASHWWHDGRSRRGWQGPSLRAGHPTAR